MAKNHGYTLIELLLAVVIGAIVIGATYSSYLIVSKQHQAISAYAEVQEMGVPAMRLISRELRMTGYKAIDSDFLSVYGAIDDPIVITDSGDACCDSVQVVYDEDLNTRIRTTFYTAQRATPTRNALYMDKHQWDGAAWNIIEDQALLADYIEDFQLEGSVFNSNADPTLVEIGLIFRNKNVLNRTPQAYTAPDYNVGNFNLTANDSFHREEFTAAINIRNLREIVY